MINSKKEKKVRKEGGDEGRRKEEEAMERKIAAEEREREVQLMTESTFLNEVRKSKKENGKI